MELFLLFQQLFVTAFVALVVSFLLTKFFLSSSNGENVDRGQKGDQESVKLNKVLKVSGTKSKRKRVRFVDHGGVQEVGKVGNLSGFEGSSDQEVGKVGNFSGFGGGDDHRVDRVGDFSGFEGSNEGTSDHGVDKVGDFSGFEGSNDGSGDHGGDGGDKVENFSGFEGLRDGGQVFDVVVERDGGSGEVVGVVEELGVEGRCEIEGEIVGFGFEKSFKKSGKVVSDEGGVGQGRELVEMVVEGDGNERSFRDRDLGYVSVEKKNGCEEVVVDECVGGAGDDGVYDQSGEFEVRKDTVVEERSGGDSKEGAVAALAEGVCIEEADNEKKAGLGNDDVFEDQTGEVRVLKDLVSVESIVDGVIKQENVGNPAIDNVVTNKMIEDQIVEDDTSVTLASGGIVMDQNEEVRVVEVSQGTGVEEEDKGISVEKGLVSDEDDDWEGIERTDLEKVFAAAANYVDHGGKADKLLNLGNDEQMQLYALHKIAMEGPCYEGQPMALKINARAKWNAWQKLGNMSPEVAMEQYVSLLSDKDPGWKEGQTSVDKLDLLEFANPGTPEPINKQIQ